jgi:carboxylesterase type B
MTVWYLTSIWLFSLVFGGEGKDLPVVNIPDQGLVSGKEVALTRSQKAIVYLAIPFAHPPIHPRLRPPKTDPLPSWTDVKNATSFAPACPQNRRALREHHYFLSDILSDQIDTLEFSEDCLYLNIFVPDGKRRNWQMSHMTYSCTFFCLL